MATIHFPEAFLRPGENLSDLYDADPIVLAVDGGWVEGYRVVYEQLAENWAAYSPDLDGVISTGDTREEVERNMREAIPFHLEGIALDRAERPWMYDEAAHA